MTIAAAVDFLDFLVWRSLVPDWRPRFLITGSFVSNRVIRTLVLDPRGLPAPFRRPPAEWPGLLGDPDGRPRLTGVVGTGTDTSLGLFLDPTGRPRLTGVTGTDSDLDLFLDPTGRPRLTGVKPEYNISLQSHMVV